MVHMVNNFCHRKQKKYIYCEVMQKKNNPLMSPRGLCSKAQLSEEKKNLFFWKCTFFID